MEKKPFNHPVFKKIAEWMIANNIPGNQILSEENVILFNEFVKTLPEEDREFLRSDECTPIVLTAGDKITDEGRRIFERILDYQP